MSNVELLDSRMISTDFYPQPTELISVEAPTEELDIEVLMREIAEELERPAVELDAMRTERENKHNGSGDDLFPTLKS